MSSNDPGNFMVRFGLTNEPYVAATADIPSRCLPHALFDGQGNCVGFAFPTVGSLARISENLDEGEALVVVLADSALYGAAQADPANLAAEATFVVTPGSIGVLDPFWPRNDRSCSVTRDDAAAILHHLAAPAAA